MSRLLTCVVSAAWLSAVVLVASGSSQGRAVTLRVAAASDLRFALEEVVASFRRAEPMVDVAVTYGSSGNFHAQVIQGAPYDLFLSADRAYADDLVRRERADAGAIFTYAMGRLVLWVPRFSLLEVSRGFSVLGDPRVRRIAIANPAHAPYGRAAEAAMKTAGVFSQAQPKLVLGDNVTQAAQFAESGAADIGMIARSLAIAPAMRERGRFWDVPASMHPPLEQSGVVLARGAVLSAARRFRAFLLGEEGRTVLHRYGFVLPVVQR